MKPGQIVLDQTTSGEHVVIRYPTFHLAGGIFLFVRESINDEGAAKTLGIDFFTVRF